jgi:formate-dependent nitrite reductase membrane component NrfD
MENGKKQEIMVFLGKMTQTMVMIMEIFKDNNNWNEKSIIGFIAFAIMCVIMIADLVTGYVGKDLIINEFVYDSFVLVVLGCFGISGLEKFAKKQ